MAVTCTTSALADASACYLCIPSQDMQAVRILLLCNFINGETMTCTPQTLVDAAVSAGFNRMSHQQANAVEILLLCTLANTGGGGGGGSVEIFAYSGAPPPTDPPTNPLAAAIAYSEDGSGPTFYWNVGTQSWF